MIFSVESISLTSSMIITNASLKILIFVLGFHDFMLDTIFGECLQIDLDGGNMIKCWLIEYEILDILHLLHLLHLLATNNNLSFKELINFMMFIDHAKVSGDDEFTDLTDAELMKSVTGYQVL
jgi:hypothetical protein